MNIRNKYGRRYRSMKPLFLLFFVAVLFIISAAVMWLWNLIIPDVTGFKSINFWQSMGLVVLMRLLTGNLRGASNRHRRVDVAKRQLRERFLQASPEEREAIKAEWRIRCRNKDNR